MKKLEKYLPLSLLQEVKKKGDVNEIRIKRNSRVSIYKDGAVILLDHFTDSDSFDIITDKLLDRSYHSKLPQLLRGYISLGEGYRCGVMGHAVSGGGELTNLSEITSVSIRIPHLVRGICEPIVNYLRSTNYSNGVLIYSPPGKGKTTLIRDLAIRLADVPIYRRVALIDERRELYLPMMQRFALLDVYVGYPKAVGIENAIRSMSPDILICDEIGNREETNAILSNISCGVPIIATAHGESMESLGRRENIRELLASGVFGICCGISRRQGSSRLEFDINEVSDGI